jgi:hypothetical protein
LRASTLQAISRAPVAVVDKATVAMLAMMLIGELSRHGIEVRDSDRTLIKTIDLVFRSSWDELLQSTDRYQIYKRYEQLTGGKDIRLEWGLPFHGLTFTIDRVESGEDPRF